jgi:hypothetical protein
MKNIVLAGLLMASTSVMASEYSIFVGAEGVSLKSEADSGAESDYENGFGLRGGVIGENSRVFVSYQNVDEVDFVSVSLEGMSDPYEWFSWLSTRAFLGFHGGMTSFDDNTNELYGAQAGMMMTIPLDISFEAGYRYSLSEIDGIDNFKGFYGAANFQF